MVERTSGSNGNGRHLAGERAERDPAEIRAEIERAREQVALSALALRRRIAEATDWRGWFARRPGTILAAAFGIGLLLALRGRRRHG